LQTEIKTLLLAPRNHGLTLNIRQQPQLPHTRRPIISIGAGSVVRDAHLPAYAKAGFLLAGVFDPDQEKAVALAEDFDLPTAFPSLEAAVAAAPEGAVFDIAVPATVITDILPHLPDEAGVLIQKPMGEFLSQARDIRRFCREKGLKAAVNFQLRYAANSLGARSIIEQGAIGDLHDIEINVNEYMPWHLWAWLTDVPRVEIIYHSIHYIDLILSFLGKPDGVYAKTTLHPLFSELAATRSSIILDYGETVRASVTTNHGHNFGDRHQWAYVKWEGTKGAIRTQIGVVLNYPRGRPDSLEYCLLKEGNPPEWTSVPLAGQWFPDAFIGPMANLQCFLEGSADHMPTAVENAYHTMAVAEAAYASSKQCGLAPEYD
jgi:predicted dehydrogenase